MVLEIFCCINLCDYEPKKTQCIPHSRFWHTVVSCQIHSVLVSLVCAIVMYARIFHSYFYCSVSLVCNIALPKRYIHGMASEIVEKRGGELYSGVRAARDIRLFKLIPPMIPCRQPVKLIYMTIPL